MAFKQVRVSDLTGNEIKDHEVVTVVVRSENKVFDATAEELSSLKRLSNVIELEYKHADGTVEQVICTQAEFAKLVPAEKLAEFDSARGRRSGFSPRS
ncbi:hypothetical protein [Rhodococcus ruber]|uniref:hypothetical protein n=1 Tax=Rhodococcus ruber TaxID=1830 RepID=UPI001F1E58B5|nr:hypothetical protein [Rhodococcus ruber]MCF8783248.1 hypothetical protein [Rhodococcus ruber]